MLEGRLKGRGATASNMSIKKDGHKTTQVKRKVKDTPTEHKDDANKFSAITKPDFLSGVSGLLKSFKVTLNFGNLCFVSLCVQDKETVMQ